MKLRHRVGIGTSMRMSPDMILWHLGIDIPEDRIRFHYDAGRGWQIAGVDAGGSFYVDCDEENHCVWVIR